MKTTFPLSLCLLWVAVFVTRASAQDPFAPTTIRAGDSNAVARALAAGGPVDTNLLAELHADAMARLAPADESSAPSFKPLPVPAVRAAATVPQARQSLEIFGTGARARFGPAEVTFAGNALAAEAVEMVGPQGLRLRSRILGVAYLDPNSGQSVLLAEPRDATGEVLPPDRVVFWDALDDLSADVVYTLRPNSLEQDVILRRQLPPPEEFGLRGDALQLAVITEFFSPPVPRRTARTIAIADPLAARGSTPTLIADETIKFGAWRIVEGRAFSLGDDPEPVPTGKSWTVIEGRHFLVEATPLQLIARKLAALPRYAGSPPRRPTGDFHDLLAAHRRADASGPLLARMEVSNRKLDAPPGVVLDYLIVHQALLNVNFADNSKWGMAAAGQDAYDYWNVYYEPGESSAALVDLEWSDGSGASAVGIVVSNAPALGEHTVIADAMYRNFVYGSNSARLTVTITNLPSDVYDLFVYAPRTPANGVPVVELKRAGTSLWIKSLTHWGSGWYSPIWEEHEQYVRFRDIAVTNQTLTLEVIPAAGYAPLSGLQIVPSDAVPSDLPTNITHLLNVDTAIAHSNKVGFAVVGLDSTDVWNHYSFGGATVASLTNLKWSDDASSAVGLVLRNGPGQWGNLLPDVMLRSYVYAQNQGNITVTLTNLPSGTYELFLYGHTPNPPDNAIFEVWSDNVNWGIKGTSLQGYGPTSNHWELGQQYVRFSGVGVVSNRPVILQSKKTTYGYNNLSGLQLARTGDLDLDADGLPDAWEMKWFGTLDYSGSDDYNGAGLNNLRKYQLGLNPIIPSKDSDGDGIADWLDAEFPWFDDAPPPGAILYGTWNWVTSWYDGTGWSGTEVSAQSGSKFRATSHVTNNVHQHYFERALGVMRARTGDVFYAYVNLDPTFPPAEVMLQFQVLGDNGNFTWEHRAYWGANHINWGVNNSNSRRPMGSLPSAGNWVRLEVPASVLGLEGRIVEGMAFTLWGGRAAWDSAGIFNPDLDGDGLPDVWEIEHFGDLSQSGENDYDGDGWTNFQEWQNGTNPTGSDLDSDGDGVVDWIELVQGRNPNSPSLPGSMPDDNDGLALRVHTPLK